MLVIHNQPYALGYASAQYKGAIPGGHCAVWFCALRANV